MIKKEYSRMIKSIPTISIIIILTAISVISFIISLADKKMNIAQLNDPPEFININTLINYIDEYNGFKFIFRFWYVSDFYFIFIVALFLFIGVFLSSQIQKHKEGAYGNLIVGRIGYKRYLSNTLVSQSLYIFSVIAITNILSLVIAFIMGGVGANTNLSGFDINYIQALIIIFVQNMLISIIAVLVNGCSLLISCYIKNKYILQAFPLFIFLILPQLIASTIGNISDIIAKITLPFVILNELMAVDNLINIYIDNKFFPAAEIMTYLIPIISYFILFIVLYYINLKKNERNYI